MPIHTSVSTPANSRNEVPFGFEELFFSRTNPSGIIQSGNNVFQRVSMYPWEELLGKPHNIIRHADMPRGVFWLLWDYLKRGEPIGAYVKNRAKDGRYYWVFAIVTPVVDGFLSVRFKPSAMLPVIEREYAALVKAEQAGNMHARDGAAMLLGRLTELGYADYRAFMADAIGRELAARSVALSRPPNATLTQFDALATAAASLRDHAAKIFAAYELNKYVPLNLTIQAAQLGDMGATIAVISKNYDIISAEIKDTLSRFAAAARDVVTAIHDGQFRYGVALVQAEMEALFRTEPACQGLDSPAEQALLERQGRLYSDKAVEGLRVIAEQTVRFRNDCGAMKHLASGLEVTRVMGKMESARLHRGLSTLDELIDELKSFQTSLSDNLAAIDRVNAEIDDRAGSIQKTLREARTAGPAASPVGGARIGASAFDPPVMRDAA
jgi:aerotaxis receptor